MRRLLINSMMNMRELGGYLTLDGQETQYGRFIRSDAPCNLSSADINFLVSYGIRTSIDLRTKWEMEEFPSSLSNVEGINYQHIPFSTDIDIMLDLGNVPKEWYIPMTTRGNNIPLILETMAEEPGGVVFNCAGGKDRTGIISILLLLIAKVPIEDVKADYQVTYTYIHKMAEEIHKATGRSLDRMKSEADWINPLLAYIADSGGAEAFLLSAGVSMDTIKKIKLKFLS